MSEWQPIETAPKDGTPVIIAQNGKYGWYIDVAENWHDTAELKPIEDRWTARESGVVVCDAPTHWMSLPQPPQSS